MVRRSWVNFHNPFWVVIDRAYRGFTGGFLLLQIFSVTVAISVSSHVYFFFISLFLK